MTGTKSRRPGSVLVGTSGWNYPSGLYKWSGLFYPSQPRGKAKDFDDLAYYAERFTTVEVNNTFYRPPTIAMAKSWVDRTPPAFVFSVKLYQRFTHPQMHRQALAGKAAPGLQADVEQFRAALDVLADAGKLGAVLCQFPSSFKSTAESQQTLLGLFRDFREYQLAIELRHASWSEDVVGTIQLLNEHRAAWVQIDEPKFRSSIRQNQLPNITSFYYLRAHGRNGAKWWHHDHRDQRYDYFYSPDEIAGFAETLDAVRHIVKRSYAYMNNHPNAQAPVNALQLRKQLGEKIDGEFAAELLSRYPQVIELLEERPTAPSRSDQVRVRVRETR